MKTFYYDKYREYDTDIHVFRFNINDVVLDVVQPENRSPLTEIFSNWWRKLRYTLVASMNGMFFGWSTKSNPAGLAYLYEGVLMSDTVYPDEFLELIYANGKFHIEDFTAKEMLEKYEGIHWGISVGNQLVGDYKKNLRKSEKFPHTKYRNPRTMFAWDEFGTVWFVVNEGRKAHEAGLTDDQQAEFLINRLNVKEAVNLDGGDSTTLAIEGKIVNELSGATQRPIANAITAYVKGPYEIVRTDHVQKTPESFYLVDAGGHAQTNFLWAEVACNCGAPYIPDCHEQRNLMQKIRDFYNDKYYRAYIVVDVWYRCKKCNDALYKKWEDWENTHTSGKNPYNKPSMSSRHLWADACDSHVMVKDSYESDWRELPSGEVVKDAIALGFNNVGRYDTFSHLGISPHGFSEWDNRTKKE